MSNFLSRDSILQASDIQVADVEVPEWGGTVRVREMTTAEVEHFSLQTTGRDGQVDPTKIGGVRAQVVSWCMVDNDGKPLLKKSDVEELQKHSNRVLGRLFDKIMALSDLAPGKSEEDADTPKKE